MSADFRPFAFLLILATVNETISHFLINSGFSNAIMVNLYCLIEEFLWLWQFKRWGDFGRRPWIRSAILVISCAIFAAETLIYRSTTAFTSAHVIFYSFCIVFLAINHVNLLIVEERKSLLRNSRFLICSGVILFYTYRIMTESFYWFNIKQSLSFWRHMHRIILYANLIMNLLFLMAALKIPTRRRLVLSI